MKTFKQKLIDHGYPKMLIENWDDPFCEHEWKVLSQYLPMQNNPNSRKEDDSNEAIHRI